MTIPILTIIFKQIEIADIKNYKYWYLDRYDILKLNSFCVHMRFWRMMYATELHKTSHHTIHQEMKNDISKTLRDHYDLDPSARPKPVLSIDDLHQILHHHWVMDTDIYRIERQQVQLALIMLIMVCTTSRPGALVECSSYQDSNEALCYKDIHLILVRDPADPPSTF
ncbi:hypothetical protein MMC16_007526 [Acarospora aff. strigata]|nr:hypothetical protein [Acarospora aff. strigata]